MYSTNTMISEVEKNQQLLMVDDVLIYTDNSNCEKFFVTELFKGGFIARNDISGENVYFFSELQKGWEFTSKTKKENTELFHFKYV